MLVEVIRTKYRNDGTFGTLYIDDWPVCVTLELPWKNNDPQVSCIPTIQTYAERVESLKFGNTFEVKNVPNRTHILFHGANTIADLLGCIGLAEFYHRFAGQAGVANPSKGAAMIEFHQLTKDVNKFDLHIYDIVSGRK
jgi:hypothetical protein